jgi:mannosyltransferase OCH1-like enzyme
VNKIIHQIWVGPEPIPLRERYFIRDIKLKNPNWEYMFWTDSNLPELPNNIKEIYNIFGKDKQYAFQADILRLYVIKEYGGLYVDVDFQPLNSFDGLEESSTIFCSWNNLLLNGFFGADKNHESIIKACDEVSLMNTWYGPSWFTSIVQPYADNIITLDNFEKQYAKHHALHSWGK